MLTALHYCQALPGLPTSLYNYLLRQHISANINYILYVQPLPTWSLILRPLLFSDWLIFGPMDEVLCRLESRRPRPPSPCQCSYIQAMIPAINDH